MNKINLAAILSCFLIISLFITHCSGNRQSDTPSQSQFHPQAGHEEGDETPELAGYMTSLQQYTHKFALAVDAENTELAEFYLHEMEELAEKIREDVPTYEGYEIAKLTGSFLVTSFEPVDKAVESADWAEARKQLKSMIQKCNACHDATDHGFIRLTAGFDKNPYNQDFGSR